MKINRFPLKIIGFACKNELKINGFPLKVNGFLGICGFPFQKEWVPLKINWFPLKKMDFLSKYMDVF